MSTNIVIDNAQGGIESGGADISLPASPTAGAALVAGPNSAYAELVTPPLMRNRVINGAQMVSQRYDDRLITPAPGVYTTDRWIAASNITRPYSVYFDGNGDYLTFNSSASSTLSFGAGDFTFETWFNFSSIGNQGLASILTSRTAADAANEIVIYLVGTANTSNATGIQFGYWTSPGAVAQFNFTSSASPAANVWHHLAITRSSSTIRVFLNGSQIGSATYSGNISTTGVFDIGRLNAGDVGVNFLRYFNGYISNLRIVKGTALYTANFTPSTTQLTAVSGTSLLACASSTIVDKSSNAFAITASGNAAVNNLQPFGNSWSNYFDGTDDRLTPPASSQFAFGTGDFTIEFWFNSNDVSSATQKGFFQTSDTAGGLKTTYTSGIFIGQGANKSAVGTNGAIRANILGTTIGSTGAVITTATWYHCALTRASGVVRLFLNGALIDSATISGSIDATNLVVGSYYSAAFSMNGYISNFHIIKGTALYTSDFAPPTGNLDAIAGTSLLTCASNSFKDKSSNNFTITPAGNAAVNALSPFSNVNPGGTSLAGRFAGWSNYFDGSGDYLSLTSATNLSLAANSFTIEAWVYPQEWPLNTNTDNAVASIISKQTEYILYYSPSGVVTFSYVNSTLNGWNFYWTPGNSISRQVWNHIAVCKSGSSLKIFVNGVQSLSTSWVNTTGSTSNPIVIGRNMEGGYSYQANAYISNLRIINGTALYTTNFTPSTTPLVAVPNTSLLTCASENFQDKSSNSFALTPNGNVAVSSMSPFTAQAPAGFTRSLGWAVTSPWSAAQNEIAVLQQRIEGTQIADLAWGTASAKSVTLSFWVRSPVAGTYCVSFRNENATRSYVAEYSVAAANTWERKTVTIPGDTSGVWTTTVNLGLRFDFDLGSGAVYTSTANSWQSGNYLNTSNQTNFIGTALASGVRENNFMITGVQLEAGSVATPFEFRPIQAEIALCQRYFARMSSLSGNYVGFGVGAAWISTSAAVFIKFPQTMRSQPVIRQSNTCLFDTQARPVTNVSFEAASTDCGKVLVTSSGLTATNGVVWCGNNDPSAYVELDSEI